VAAQASQAYESLDTSRDQLPRLRPRGMHLHPIAALPRWVVVHRENLEARVAITHAVNRTQLRKRLRAERTKRPSRFKKFLIVYFLDEGY